MKRVVGLPSNGKNYIMKGGCWFSKYVSKKLGELHNFHVGNVKKENDFVTVWTPIIELPIECDEEKKLEIWKGGRKRSQFLPNLEAMKK